MWVADLDFFFHFVYGQTYLCLWLGFHPSELASKDLVAFIVWSNQKLCLAVLQVVSFHYKAEKSLKLTMDLEQITNGQGDYQVNGQIIELSPSIGEDGLWDWTKCYVHLDVSSRTAHLTQKQFVIEVPALLVLPIAAAPALTGLNQLPQIDINVEIDSTWRIKQADLDNVLKSAWNSLNGEGEDLLGNLPLIWTVKNPNVLPYRDQSGVLSNWSGFKVSITYRNHQENQLSSSRTFLCIFSWTKKSLELLMPSVSCAEKIQW